MLRYMVKCAAGAALCACAIATPAEAQGFTVTKQTRVSVRDLDLRDERDVKILRGRVNEAVAYVCDVPRQEVVQGSSDRCITGALEHADEQISVALRQARRNLALARPLRSGKR